MDSEKAHIICSYLDSQQQDMEETLGRLTKMETPSRDPLSQEKIFDYFQKIFSTFGYRSFHQPGKETGGFSVFIPENRIKGKPLQLLIGHCDTVWPIGTIKKMPVEVDKVAMRGPGVFDMKAGLTQIIFALKTIKELNLNLEVTPVVLINADEEIGSRESSTGISRLARIASRAFILEPPLGPSGKLKTGRKGLARFTITVIGKAAHAGLNPELGVNAIVELSYQIQRLFEMNDPEKGISVNVGMVEGGLAANVVAPTSSATIDVRVLNLSDAEEISNKIRSLKPYGQGVELTIDGGFGRMPMERTSRNQALWLLARETGQSMGLELQQATAGGGSDGNTTSLYTATLDGLGAVGAGAHAKHEFVYLDKMRERTALLTLLLTAPALEHNGKLK